MSDHIGKATTMIDLDALEKLADEATPGPWGAADWDDDFGDNLFTVEASEPEVLHEGQSSIWPDGIRRMRVAETIEGQRPTEDAAFIAAANPATIKALIAELKEARAIIRPLADCEIIEPDQPLADDITARYLFSMGEIRAARAFLARNGKGEG